ncbi:alpha/beta-hydrolase [Clavulina sp. PMI_390]|nr:alpha/beta-hydrolase [Clavulina sp. PMI_390]
MAPDMEKDSGSEPRLSLHMTIKRTLFTALSLLASFYYIVPHSLISLEHCSSYLGWRLPTPKGPIDWSECGEGYECGFLQVPLDYHDNAKGNITLAVGRYLATSKQEERLGSIFANPGGPGGSGLSFLKAIGRELSEIFDGRYDIVSWDPRGVGDSSPRLDCFPDKLAQDIFNLEHGGGFQVGNLSTMAAQESFRAQLYKFHAVNRLGAELCEERAGEFLEYLGTTAVVRDLEYFSSVLEGKETPVNYAGFSYGTIVGAYFVNMFPDRVGRILIDGVVEPYAWANDPWFVWGPNALQDTEKAFKFFVNGCIEAGPERCPLAVNGTTAQQLDRRIRDAVDDLVGRPLPVPHASRPGILTSANLKYIIFRSMYKPREWDALASNLAALLAGDGAPLLSVHQASINFSDTTSAQKTSYIVNAVSCSDGPPMVREWTSEESVQQALDMAVETYETSTTLFSGIEQITACSTWKATASERYTGPWNSSLANPILIIGNTADPICPVANAKQVNEYLADSRLIIQDSPGHCALSVTSLCTGKAFRDYFIDGILPPNGKVCPLTEILFPPKPSVNSSEIDDLATMDQWALEEEEKETFDHDDLILLRKLKAFGEAAQNNIDVFRGL